MLFVYIMYSSYSTELVVYYFMLIVGMTSLIHGINTHLSDLSTHPVHTGSLFEIFLMVALVKRFALTGKSQIIKE